MVRSLVVVEPRKEVEELLRIASDFALGSGAELVLFHTVAESETEPTREKMRQITGADQNYRPGIEGAKSFALDLGEKYLPTDVTFSIEGAFGDKAEQVLGTAQELNCNHIFLTGRRRSPTGKAMFGDTTQTVLLDSDVPVTTVMRE